MFPVDVNWLEQNIEGRIYSEAEPAQAGQEDCYPHRVTLLRPELIEAYHAKQTRDWINQQIEIKTAEAEQAEKTEETAKASAEDGDKSVEAPGSATSEDFVKVDGESRGEKADGADGNEEEQKSLQKKQMIIDASEFKLTFNPDAFVDRPDRPLHSRETAKPEYEDESTTAVRDAANYLRATVISSLVREIMSEETIPLDSSHLSQILHKKGINIRYLGLIAEATKQLPEGKTVNDDMKEETLAFLAKLRVSCLHQICSDTSD